MLKTRPLANSLAVAMGIFYVVCRLLAAVAPDFLRSIGQSWFHTYDLSALPAGSPTGGGFIWGLVTSMAAAWIFGYLWGWFYNRLAK